jgi:F420-non-reducing hydrogenase iron-sulfur subunit
MNNEPMNNGKSQTANQPISESPTSNLQPPTSNFQPQITVFMCIYCAYMAADTAGALRIKYPANVKLVKLPCTGKTDVRYLLEAFEQGADGVCVVGCPIGNCHHVHGNVRGRARVEYAKALLDQIGLGGKRLEMYFVSGGMGNTFANAIREMAESVKDMGPNPLRGQGDKKTRRQGDKEIGGMGNNAS